MRPLSSTPPRSAYLHIPFCAHRCGYCNFAVIAGRNDLAGPLLGALAIELSWLGRPREVDTLYFGGGTPTQLSTSQLERLCTTAVKHFPLARGYEWTVEANPADLDAERTAVLAECGVNRISLGAQSFDDEKLKSLERDHAAGDVAAAVELAHDAGMQVSVDLIFAAPGETLADWQIDLERAFALQPDHVSTYGLTYEKGTLFWNRLRRGELAEADEELSRSMYLTAIDRLSTAGFEHYEVSNFAKPNRRSRHNETYWAGREYFAAGPGAARYVNHIRETNHRSTTTYLKRIAAGVSPVAEREALDPEQRAREQLILGLRRLDGVEHSTFARETGYRLESLCGAELQKFVKQRLLEDNGWRVCLTRDGLLVSDAIWPELL